MAVARAKHEPGHQRQGQDEEDMLFPLAPDPLAAAEKPHQRRRTRGDLGDGAEGIIQGVLLHWHRFRIHLIPSASGISSKRSTTRPLPSSHNLIRRGCGW